MSSDATVILQRLCSGDDGAIDELLPLVYDELRAVAQLQMNHERPGHTLQATALVHEAYLRLVNIEDIEWQGRAHFCAVASGMIRRLLVDHARGKKSLKRGGQGQRLDLTAITPAFENNDVSIVELDDAMIKLSELSQRQARLVELRFFGGLTVDQAAEMLDISPRTAADDWTMAKAWLRRELSS